MKSIVRQILPALAACGLFAVPIHAANWTAGMTEGKPEIKSISQLAFGPEGILLIADSKSAALFAVATGDTKTASGSSALKVEGINQKIAGLLGTGADQILIDDLAVNPVSHNAYLAVSRGRGPGATPVLVRVKAGGTLEVVALDKDVRPLGGCGCVHNGDRAHQTSDVRCRGFAHIHPTPRRAARPKAPEIKVIALYKDVGPLG